jgi:hypothetical protein
MDTIAKILGSTGLSEEMIASLQEAFDAKVAEAREAAEMSIREEFSTRYEHDKSTLVEAMDRMLTDVVEKSETEKAAEIASLKESQSKYAAAVKEARSHYKAKIKEHVGLTGKFVTEHLARNIKALAEQKQALVAKKTKLDEQYEAVKADVTAQTAARLKRVDEFVVRQVQRELNDFAQDRRALVETRVALVTESKRKLNETQKKFVTESAKKVEAVVSESLSREMTQLHEDIERNRQNTFGRRIFEAVAAEYMTSYLAEGTEIRLLQNVLESKETELSQVKGKLSEAAQALDGVTRKVKLAEDRAARSKVMNELLSNLRGEKRAVMESMLETTKTEHLRGAFNKFLPVVLNESTRKAPEKKVLAETKAPVQPRRVVTGDKANRLTETVRIEAEHEASTGNDFMAQVVRLAGIQK